MTDGLRLPYVPAQTAQGEVVLRPQLPLTLINDDQQVSISGLLDSGADVNVLPYRVGIELGAVWEDQPNILTLSGNLAQVEARGIILTAQVGQFAPVRLAFAWTRAENVPILLGQVNFFMEFDVCFYRAQAGFEVRPKTAGSMAR